MSATKRRRWKRDGPDYRTGGERVGGEVWARIDGFWACAWYHNKYEKKVVKCKHLGTAKAAVERWLERQK